jgi:hypothetical protein
MASDEGDAHETQPSDTPAPPGHGRTCFVIGPIGNRHAAPGTEERTTYEEAIEVYEEVIVRACQAPSVGLEPVRADGLARAGELTEQIFRRLRDDDVVIADLTDANPNVMYELGLRHTRNKLTLQLGEFSRLPFDVNVIRTVQFSRSPNGLINARKELEHLLEAGLAGDWDPVSATRVWNALGDDDEPPPPTGGTSTEPPNEPMPPASEGERPGTGEEEEALDYPGLIDKLAEAEDAQELLLSSTSAIGTYIELMGTIADEEAAKMRLADERGLGMKMKLAHLVTFAKKLDEVADNLEYHVRDYSAALGTVSTGFAAVIDHIETEAPEQGETPEFREFGETIRGLATTSRESLSGLSGLVDSMKDTARYAKVLRRPTNRIAAALSQFANATETLNELDRRLRILGIELPDTAETGDPSASSPVEEASDGGMSDPPQV